MPDSILHTAPVADRYALEVSAGAGAGQPLIAFDLSGGAVERLAQGLGLVHLGGDFDRENWLVPGAVKHQRLDCGWQAGSGNLMSIALACSDLGGGNLETRVAGLYRELIDRARASGYPELLRIWNYLPDINEGSGDNECYRRFCVGRGAALKHAGLDDAAMCAATAIGTSDGIFRLIALAGRRPGLSFENPRQVSAWQYPARYGPRSPAFARATAVELAGHRIGLLISGTASVIGHATAHPGNVLAQADEAAANVDTLLQTAATKMNAPGLQQLGEESLVRVYVRQAGDWPHVAERLRSRWPEARLAGLRGDICRRDLLVEIEAWHCARVVSISNR